MLLNGGGVGLFTGFTVYYDGGIVFEFWVKKEAKIISFDIMYNVQFGK